MLVVLVLVVLVVMVVAGLWWNARQADLDRLPQQSSPAAAAAVLHDLVEGLNAGRQPDDLATLARAEDPAAREQLVAVSRNVRAAGITDVQARYLHRVGEVADDGTWQAAVALTWRVGHLDQDLARAEVLVAFAPDGESLALAGFPMRRDDARPTPLWLQDQVWVVRNHDVLVLLDGPEQRTPQIAAQVRAARAAVSDVLGQAPAVVVEVPATTRALEEALGAPPGTYDGIAAVTAAADGSHRPEAPLRVLLNPDSEPRPWQRGARTVLAHELVHVALGAGPGTGLQVEPWLEEGLAELVALHGSDLPDAVLTARARRLVREAGVPEDLPGPAAFDARGDALQAAYELSWLACRVLEKEIGPAGVVALHRDVVAGTALEEALRASGMTRAGLVRRWQRALRAWQ